MQYTVKVDWAERELRPPTTPPKSPKRKDDECASTACSSGESECSPYDSKLRFSYDKRWLESLQAGLNLVSTALLQAEAGAQKTETLIAEKAALEQEGTQVYVTGLPRGPVQGLEDEVRRAFVQCGPLAAVNVVNGPHCAVAFLIFESPYGAALAVQALDQSRWPSDPASDLAWAPLIRVSAVKRPQEKPASQPESGKLFIGGLPTRVTEPEVAALFGQLGPLAEVQLVRGQHEVVCFLQFRNAALAHFAIKALNGTYWGGKDGPISVRLAKPTEDASNPVRTTTACPQFLRAGTCSYGAACQWSHASPKPDRTKPKASGKPKSPEGPRGTEKPREKPRGAPEAPRKEEEAPRFTQADFPALGKDEFPALGGSSKSAKPSTKPQPKGGVWA